MKRSISREKVTPVSIKGEGALFRCIRCADDAEWLQQRTKGIGGSDVAAIMGISPWRTPADVWFEKTGRVEPEDISDRPHVRRGVELEGYVGEKFKRAHKGFKVARVNAICQSKARPWAQASLDYQVCEKFSYQDREPKWGVLEIKTSRNDADWQDGIPAYYMTQVQHYLSVTGRSFAWVAVQFDSDTIWEYREYRIERDEEDIAVIDFAVDTFWHDYVEADVMPVLVGSDGEVRGLTQMYARPQRESITMSDHETLQLISDYQDAAYRAKYAEADKKKAASQLMARIGEARALYTDTSKVTWVRSESERMDAKRLKAERPEIYAEYAETYARNGGLIVTDLK